MKIFCIGRNYALHAKEMGSKVPTSPLVFMKPATALLKDMSAFYYPEFSNEIHYEVEVILKICKNGKNINPKFALDYVQSISLGIDFTARDIQAKCKEKGHPWEIAKSFDQSALVGKLLPFDRETQHNIDFSLLKNGTQVQKGNTSDLLFDFSTLISHISKFFTIQKGDLIYTGTPEGVGEVKIGDTITGIMNGEEMFACEIK